MSAAVHSCAKCADGFTRVVCVSKYRNSVYKSLGMEVVKCRLPSACGVNCRMPAALVLVKGHPELSMDGFCGEKHRGYVVSGAWRHAQLRSLNAELDKLTEKEESLRTQIIVLTAAAKTADAPVYVPKKLNKLKVEVSDVTEKIHQKSVGLAVVMDAILADLSPDASPKRRSPA
ncbi:hypothetical protein [Oat golden stripe virus]|uniref:Uncharacterized protein n=1 Tax=Oat golden stripe virus TaxID=45103 RepID=Q9QBU5_9VIRU|nr:hypothetical protein Ogsvs2gp3 [Oat golden stripe virus]CAB57875.1 hypothetical protein [Oat golden stripe virus]